jgi:hypothetical protein
METRIPTEVRIKDELDIVTQKDMEGMEENECWRRIQRIYTSHIHSCKTTELLNATQCSFAEN